MNKVLFITHNCNFTNSFLLPQIELYKKHGFDVALASSLELGAPLIEIYDFHEISISQNPFNLFRNLKAIIEVKRLIKEYDYSIINCHTPVGGVVGRLIKLFYKDIKVCYTAHGFHFYEGAPLLNWLLYYPIEKSLARLTDKLIVINQEDFDILGKNKFKMKQKFLINGVGVDFNADLYNFPILKELDMNDSLNLIAIGQLNKNKNHMFIIKALHVLKKEYPNISLKILGEGPLKQDLLHMVIELGLEQNVEFIGYTNDVENHLIESDILISASAREGLPKSVMEGLYFSVPCLVSNCRGNIDLIQNGINGYIYEYNNIESLLHYFKEILNNYEYLTASSYQSIIPFKTENVINDYERIYFGD